MVNAARRVVQVCSTGPREYRTRTREKAAQGPGLCLGGLPALSIAAYAISKGGKRVSNLLSCFASVLLPLVRLGRRLNNATRAARLHIRHDAAS